MSLTNFFNTNSDDNVWNKHTTADERSQILTWLSPLEPGLRHMDVRESRVGGVGEWLLQTEEFRSWYAGSGRDESNGAVLFCYGDPGVGKTYISSLVIDSLCNQARGQDAAVACFYFDFAAQKEQSLTRMLGALLKQVVGGLEGVPGEIVQAYEDQKKVIGGPGPQLSDIVKMLQHTSSGKPTFICIDALDECAVGHRVKILISLNQILEKSPGTRIFVTGRPHIQDEMEKRLLGRVTTIRITPKRGDIVRYLHSRLDEDATPDAMDSSLEADILNKIPDAISEIFTLVSLNIDAILQETTIYHRQQKLNAITDGLGLGDAYDATLGRIKGQGGRQARLGIAALMWISHSERPLKSDELRHALAVEIGSPNFNIGNVPSIGTLLACCQGLVFVDKEASTVRLIHFSLRGYLRAHPELFGTAHSTIAETCLSYLNSQQVRALPAAPFPKPFFASLFLNNAPRYDLWGTPFLEYSSLYWGIHAKKELSNCAKFLAVILLDNYDNHISSSILLAAQKEYRYRLNYDDPLFFPGLHCASFFGIDEIVASLVEVKGCDINRIDRLQNTALMWAARKGHEGVAKILLERDDINPNQVGWYDKTPLAYAAECGHEGIVKLLLARDDVDPNIPGFGGQTPLVWAAQKGHEGVVKMLLRRDDVDPNQHTGYDDTPLACAAECGHGGIVKLLLAHDDIDPNKPGFIGKTPLEWATENKREGVVETLLALDNVDPYIPFLDGGSILCWAASNGYDRVVKILLARDDVNPDESDDYDQTPLACAAEHGQEEVVKILLGRDGVNPYKRDKYGKTAWQWAAKNGHAGVLALLRSPRFATHSTA